MKSIVKHPTKKWEISIIEIKDEEGIKYKITRRLPEMFIAETKILKEKKQAIKLFYEWLK